MVLADPAGSILYDIVKSGVTRAGRAAGRWKASARISFPTSPISRASRDAFTIADAESFAAARELLRKEGILGGSSTGTLLGGALRYCRAADRAANASSPSSATAATNICQRCINDFWMAEQGFSQRPPEGDLRDLISHRYEAGEVISVGPDDTLLTAFKRMRAADVSQLPVVDDDGRAVGILDESDVLVKVHADPSHFNDAGATRP